MLFVHELDVTFSPGHDQRALGGAVTTALCGHWEHDGPCTWPHRTETETVAGHGGSLTARVVFACDPADEPEVRRRIVDAARGGGLDGPDGRSEWSVDREAPGAPSPEDLWSPPANGK